MALPHQIIEFLDCLPARRRVQMPIGLERRLHIFMPQAFAHQQDRRIQPDEDSRFYRQLFGLDKIGLSTLREHRENGMPMVMANDPGLFWIAAFEPVNKDMHHHIYAIGPVFVEDISQERIDAALEQYSLIGAGKERKYLSASFNTQKRQKMLSSSPITRRI